MLWVVQILTFAGFFDQYLPELVRAWSTKSSRKWKGNPWTNHSCCGHRDVCLHFWVDGVNEVLVRFSFCQYSAEYIVSGFSCRRDIPLKAIRFNFPIRCSLFRPPCRPRTCEGCISTAWKVYRSCRRRAVHIKNTPASSWQKTVMEDEYPGECLICGCLALRGLRIHLVCLLHKDDRIHKRWYAWRNDGGLSESSLKSSTKCYVFLSVPNFL